MTKKNFKKLLSLLIPAVLIAVMALNLCSCGEKEETPNTSSELTATVIGEGATTFSFKVTTSDTQKLYTVKTDKKTVGDALLEHGLIEGEESQYGLYVKKVDGITADYDVDQTYWAFYIDGAYATSGVDTTDITAGATYEFKKER